MWQIFGKTKEELQDRTVTEQFIQRPANYEKIPPGICPKETCLLIQQELYKAWENHINKPLSDKELQEVKDMVASEIKEIEQDVEQAYAENRNNCRETIKQNMHDLMQHQLHGSKQLTKSTFQAKVKKPVIHSFKHGLKTGILKNFNQKLSVVREQRLIELLKQGEEFLPEDVQNEDYDIPEETEEAP